mgnify:CR=1 FL=1
MIKVSCVTEKSAGGDMMTAPHCHSTIEINCICCGHGKYSVAGTLHGISPGDVFVFSNNVLHRITSISAPPAGSDGGGMTILKVHFSPDILMQDVGFSGLESVFFRSFGFTHIPSGNDAAKKVFRLLSAMFEEATEGSEGDISDSEAVGNDGGGAGGGKYKSDELMTALLLAVCISIGRYVRDAEGICGERAYCDDNHRLISESIRYISQNLGAELRLDSLARAVNMSKNSYLYWFRHFVGVSPYSYIQSMRILRAVEMLRNSSASVMQIAFECGFNSTVSFNKMFKKIMGCTPTELRTNLLS